MAILFWIFYLTLLAGAMNVTALLEFGHSVSHHTGNASRLALGEGNAGIVVGIFFAYFLGALMAGYIFHQRHLSPKNRYGVVMLLMGTGLWAFVAMGRPALTLYFMALVLGLQNGLFITYHGMLIRTTHLTGYLSDAGFAIGSFLRGEKHSLQRAVFYLSSIGMFILGGWLITFVEGIWRLPILATAYILGGFYFFVLRHHFFFHK